MKRLALLWLALFATAGAQQYPIIRFEASGSERYRPAQILAATGLTVDIGKPVPLAAVRDAAQKLIDSGVFSDVAYRHRAATGGMAVQFTVKDKPADQFLPAVFENIVWLEEAELRQQLQPRVPLFAGEVPLRGRLMDDVADAVSSILKQRGIATHVSSRESCGAGEKNCTRNFSVDDLLIEVGRVALAGAPAEIVADVQQAAAEHLIGKPYRRSSTDRRLAAIVRAACLRRGFLKPQLGGVRATAEASRSDRVPVAVAIELQPGPAYRFEGQAWTGNRAIPAAYLEKLMHLYLHLPVDGAKLEADLEQVRGHYALRGYMNARVSAQPQFDDAKGTVKYTFVVEEGPLFRMGELELSGFPAKLVEEISTLWKLRKGDPFDRTYAAKFFSEPAIMSLFGGRHFVVEQSEGETPETVDVSIVLCHPSGCKPSPDALFVTEPGTANAPK